MPLPVYPVDAAGLAVLPNEATHEAREARWDWAVSLVEASMLKTNDSLLAEDLSVCDVVEHTLDYHLDGGHVLLANAAFYRYEMHNIRPPPALCVDILDEIDPAPEDLDAAAHRSASREDWYPSFDAASLQRDFAMLRRGTGEARACISNANANARCIGDYDALVKHCRELSASVGVPGRLGSLNEFLRDANARSERLVSTTKLGARQCHRRWLSPRELYASCQNVSAALGEDPREDPEFQIALAPRREPRVPFGNTSESTLEALDRMLAVLSLYRMHGKQFLSKVIMNMRWRARVMASLSRAACGVRRAAAAIERAAPAPRPPSALVGAVRSSEGAALGEVLWPHVHWSDSHALMCTCKALHEWGRMFSRELKLALVLPGGPQAFVTSANMPASGVDANGVPVLSTSKVLKLGLQFYYKVDRHVQLQALDHGQEAQKHANRRYDVVNEVVRVPHPGSGVVEDCSDYTVELVRDDDPRGRAVFETDSGNVVGSRARTPYPGLKRALERTKHSVRRTSHDVSGSSDAKLRLRFTVHVATKRSLRVARQLNRKRAMATRYAVLTPAFRVVARYSSADAERAEKERKKEQTRVRRTARAWAAQQQQQHEPEPSADQTNDDFDLDADALRRFLEED